MSTVILDIISAMILAIISTVTGWWFGTFFIFHNIWDHPSHWLLYFLRWLKLPTSLYLPFYSPLWYNYIHHYIHHYIDHYIYIYINQFIFTTNHYIYLISVVSTNPLNVALSTSQNAANAVPLYESGRCGRAERMGLAISIATSWGVRLGYLWVNIMVILMVKYWVNMVIIWWYYDIMILTH